MSIFEYELWNIYGATASYANDVYSLRIHVSVLSNDSPLLVTLFDRMLLADPAKRINTLNVSNSLRNHLEKKCIVCLHVITLC